MLISVLMAFQALGADTGQRVHFSAAAGLVTTSGNSAVTTLDVSDKLAVALHRWQIAQTFAVTYARADDSVSASSWQGSLRGDRSLGSNTTAYLLGQYERNRFAGFRSRVSPSIGVAATVVHDSSTQLSVELGVGYTWQRAVTPGDDRDYASGRVAASYRHRLGAKAGVQQDIEIIPDFSVAADVHLNTETSVTAPISTGIALKAMYTVHFVGVPEPGFRKTDRILSTGVQVTF
jgi:putative salt-induced outer membrane protein